MPGAKVSAGKVATQLMRHRALAAAETLAREGVEVEVIDPRTLVPLDVRTVGASVDRTNRLVVVQEASQAGSWSSYGTTTMQDCCKPSCSWPNNVSGTMSPWSTMYQCSMNGAPMTK